MLCYQVVDHSAADMKHGLVVIICFLQKKHHKNKKHKLDKDGHSHKVGC